MISGLNRIASSAVLALALLTPLASQAAMRLVCDGATLTQQDDKSKWDLVITNSPVGEHAKKLIFESASKEAYFAAEKPNTPWTDRSFFWMESPNALPGEYHFTVATNSDIKTEHDLKLGNYMKTSPTGKNPFKAFAHPMSGGYRLRFVLETQRGFFMPPGGISVPCKQATDSYQCRVQEYIFKDCEIQK